MSKSHSSGSQIIDPARRKFVRNSPEEGVRQAVIAYLTGTMGIPLGFLSVEKVLNDSETKYRADIVVYNRSGEPWMLVECKAPDVQLSQAAFNQIGKYNRIVKARYLLVTNGRNHYCCEWGESGESVEYLDQLPSYPHD